MMLLDAAGRPLRQGNQFLTPDWLRIELGRLADQMVARSYYSHPVALTDWRGHVLPPDEAGPSKKVGKTKTIQIRKPARFNE